MKLITDDNRELQLSGGTRINSETAADLIGIHPETFERRRHLGFAPTWFRDGPRRVRFHLRDVVAYITGNPDTGEKAHDCTESA